MALAAALSLLLLAQAGVCPAASPRLAPRREAGDRTPLRVDPGCRVVASTGHVLVLNVPRDGKPHSRSMDFRAVRVAMPRLAD